MEGSLYKPTDWVTRPTSQAFGGDGRVEGDGSRVEGVRTFA